MSNCSLDDFNSATFKVSSANASNLDCFKIVSQGEDLPVCYTEDKNSAQFSSNNLTKKGISPFGSTLKQQHHMWVPMLTCLKNVTVFARP